MLTITLGGDMQIKGCDPTAVAEIKKSLTFKNPQYDKVKKYSRYSYTKVPPFLCYYKGNGDNLRVPIGYECSNILSGKARVVDKRKYEPIKDFPKFILTPSDLQEKATQKYLSCNSESNLFLKGVCQLPTGAGKSILGLYIASKLKCKTLIVVHKEDLLRGWKNDIQKSFGVLTESAVGIIRGKERRVGKYFTIATVQTLNNLSSDMLERLYGEFSFVIQDECHHAPSTSFSLVSNFSSRYRLGITATPERGDGLNHIINLYYGDFFFRAENYSEDGEYDPIVDILPVKVIRKAIPDTVAPYVYSSSHLKGYKLIKGDPKEYKDKGYIVDKVTNVPFALRPKVPYSLMDLMSVEKAFPVVLKDLVLEYVAGHSCVVFFSQKESIRKFYDSLMTLVDEGILSSEDKDKIFIYSGDKSPKELNEVLDYVSSHRQTITLTTYSKSTEGTNVVQWEVAFFVSSMASGKNVEQALGRIRRKFRANETGVKLEIPLAYDYDYTGAYMLTNHFSLRRERYKKLGLTIENDYAKSMMFGRGFK